jgi:CelD/BcsL family acetyltransferase involved in cellulose biosynthesis
MSLEQESMHTKVEFGRDALERYSTIWDHAVSESRMDTVFLTLGWLNACLDVFVRDECFLLSTVWDGEKLLGAAALQMHGGLIEFVGKERGDYLGIICAKELSDSAAQQVTQMILDAAAAACPRFRRFHLHKIRADSGLLRYLEDASGFRCIRTQHILAPSMDMESASDALKKKSLARHERKLQRMGDLTSETYTRATDIAPRLDFFFEQHIRRWANTSFPSLFLSPSNKKFYRALVKRMDETGMLRFTTLMLDDRLIASHFGFCRAGVFTWYKPTFEPQMSKYSPGEVLIKRLIERARDEDCNEFDFTLGNEAFKQRFATENRDVLELTLIRSRLMGATAHVYQKGRNALRALRQSFSSN